ncbi:hypothetical protein AVEN_27631-1 [Araneus ventricosus]|uniref:Reverse transcriptase domain-containing protein n=1 Tax=Araneus ventricosus TaxID=182803 RepID=A0A4Y2EMV8_ARAVE|nr:hypothetical protein AVEN_27631-1 [Araneus ventricosus]
MVIKNAVNERKCADLTTLYDQLESHLRALDTLGRSKEKFADFLSPLVESCLPEDVLRTWERHTTSSILNNDAELPENSQRSLENLMAFLRQEVNGEEMINLVRSGFGFQGKVKREVVNSERTEIPSAALIFAAKGRIKCVFCSNFHPSQDCGKAGRMTREGKKTAVLRKGLCLVSLKNGHMAKKCHSNVRCVICFKRHYAVLCRELLNTSKNVFPKQVNFNNYKLPTQQIPPLLLRFRTGATGVIADIKQAFLPLSVRPEDRNFLRLLWWNIKDRSKLEFFRYCRVVFGVTSSPFLLNGSIRHHLNSNEYQLESLQTTVEKLKRGFYLDNLTTSVESQEELEQFKTQTMEIMNAASFELRCWVHIGVQDQESQSLIAIKWDTETDELYCVSLQVDIGFSETVSKRKLLSMVNSIYDPIGFTSPATVLPKLLL